MSSRAVAAGNHSHTWTLAALVAVLALTHADDIVEVRNLAVDGTVRKTVELVWPETLS
jgi:hypothetical protein